MTKEKLKTKEKIRLQNVAKEWLRTEHQEGNIQSLVNLILSFTESKDKRIEELERDYEKRGDIIISLENQLQMYIHSDKTDQLTKAKEIIKDLCGMVRELNKPNVQLTNVDYSLSEAEQFLSEVE